MQGDSLIEIAGIHVRNGMLFLYEFFIKHGFSGLLTACAKTILKIFFIHYINSKYEKESRPLFISHRIGIQKIFFKVERNHFSNRANEKLVLFGGALLKAATLKGSE
jgi:hypothetical protein